MGGGGGGEGGGGSGGCTQNTPSINIIDNARIMMMPGNIPGGGSWMAQSSSEEADAQRQALAQSETDATSSQKEAQSNANL